MLVRLASTIVLIPPAVAAMWFGTPYFEGVVLIVGALALAEWCQVSLGKAAWPATAGILAVFAASIVLSFLGFAGLASGMLVLGTAALLVAAATRRFAGNRWPAVGLLYIGFACLALLWLRADVTEGRALTVLLFGVVWATDIGAYLVGKTVGGPRLAPVISPKKTWSGAVGGLVFGIAAALAAAPGFGLVYGAGTIVAAGAGLSIASQLGDLFESRLKRRFDVKDSGALIPGHGGILDRIDGVLLASPIAVAGHWIAQGGGLLWK